MSAIIYRRIYGPMRVVNVCGRIILCIENANHTCEQAGSSMGLQVLLNAEQDEYLVPNSLSAGFRVSLSYWACIASSSS